MRRNLQEPISVSGADATVWRCLQPLQLTPGAQAPENSSQGSPRRNTLTKEEELEHSQRLLWRLQSRFWKDILESAHLQR